MNSTDPLAPPSDAPRPSSGSRSPWILRIVFVFIMIAICVIIGEVTLRLIHGPWDKPFIFVYDRQVGTWHVSSYDATNVQLDYTIKDIHLNSFGMRDRERTLAKPPGTFRIAVLGDSFMEGIQVEDEQVMSRQLEKLLGSDVEVLNFGVGGFGTTQEYLTYLDKVRPFHPDLVILGFLSGNDMRNNSKALEALYNGGYRDMPFAERSASGTWSIDQLPPKPAAENPVVIFLKKYSALYRFAWYLGEHFRALMPAAPQIAASVSRTSPAESVDVTLTHLDATPTEDVFQTAWDTTDWVLARLDQQVEQDGAKLVVVALPDAAQMEPDPRAALEKLYGAPLPADFNIDYPEQHLAMDASSAGFGYLDLTPIFRAYRDAHHLVSPYFSYAHDGHWSPLGHEVAAQAVAEFLRTKGYLPHL